MTPERWRAITEIFHGATARDASARDAFLREACKDDALLRNEVDAMLAAHENAGAFGEARAFAPAIRRLAPDTRLGAYRIEALIGAGGMGEVYRARDTRLDRSVAIKILPPNLRESGERQARFEREARMISQLTHPHICTLHDIGRDGDTDFLVMEHLEGETLAARLARGRIPLNQALQIAIEIASALDHAHRRRIVHRDLKPSNVMLTKDGAKLLDFGLAKLAQSVVAGVSQLANAPTVQTAEGTLVGTLAYMAPEQLEGKEADARADVWALGCVIYEQVTGRCAFEGTSQPSLIAAILEHEPPPASTAQPLAPQTLDWVVNKCLAKNPEERWQSAADLRSSLQWIVKSGDRAASTGGRGKRLRARHVTSAVLVAFAAGLFVTVVATRRDAAPLAPVTFLVAPPEGTTFATPLAPPVGLPWLAVAPHGRALAFVAMSTDGRQRLWVRPLDATDAHPLAGTDGAQAPFWSPDSRFIAFFAQGKLKYVDANGGPAQILADAPWAQGGAWNSQNVIVFTASLRGDGLRKVVVGAGGSDQPVTRLDPSKGQFAHVWPDFLPDGQHFLYTVVKPGTFGPKNEIWVGSIDGAEPRMVATADANARYVAPGYIVYPTGRALMARRFDLTRLRAIGEGDPIRIAGAVAQNWPMGYTALSVSTTGVMAYATAQAGDSQVVWRDRSGKRVGSLLLSHSRNPALSHDGTMLAVCRVVPQAGMNIWLYDLKRKASVRFTFDFGASPLWSPDGRSIAFIARRNGKLDQLFRKPTAEPLGDELLSPMEPSIGTDWSADGRFIVFHTAGGNPRTAWDVWMLSVPDLKARPVANTVFNEIHGAISPDGRWLAYSSDESGVMEVYVRPFPAGGSKWLVSTAGGVEPRWRADGRELFYVSADRRLMAAAIHSGSMFESELPQPLFEMNIEDLAVPFHRRYDPTADGQRFVVAERTAPGGPMPITVVVNWPGLLKK